MPFGLMLVTLIWQIRFSLKLGRLKAPTSRLKTFNFHEFFNSLIKSLGCVCHRDKREESGSKRKKYFEPKEITRSDEKAAGRGSEKGKGKG